MKTKTAQDYYIEAYDKIASLSPDAALRDLQPSMLQYLCQLLVEKDKEIAGHNVVLTKLGGGL